MILSASEYLLGSLELGVIVAALAFAAWRVRACVLVGWSGAPARVVEAVLASVALIWISELLGTFSAFEEWTVLAGSVAAAVAAGLICPRIEARRRPGAEPAPPAPTASRVAWACAAVATAAVAAAWMVPTLQALAGGMDRADTLWYHMPQAARWVQTGDLGAIDYFDPIFFAAYYPANSEVFHAVPILAFGRDIVSPLINLGFLALGLVSAYAIGRPYGLGPHALLGGAIALGSQQLVEFQAGEALNDITGVAFLMAAVAILVNAWAATDERGIEHKGGALSHPRDLALMIAGLSAGLAAGTKLSFLAPVLALAIGVAWIAGGRTRTKLRALALFAVPAFAAGGYWYLRNLVAIGNPIPFTSWGPLGLPSPERAFELREPFSVFHYWNDFDVWSDWFFPGLDESFGVLWPLVIAAFVGAGIYALWRGASPLIRVLGAVVLFTTAAYVFTPLTAAGEEGAPIAFEWNVRYIAPGAAIGLALLPVLLAGPGADVRRRAIVLAALSLLALATIGSLVQWEQGHAKGAIAAGVGVLVTFGVAAYMRDRNLIGPAAPRRVAVAIGALVLVGALAGGWWEQRHFLERRYDDLSPQLKLAEAARWARGLENATVAVAGVRGVFNQYPFYGTDLSNHVQWLGVEGPDGAYLRIGDCETWRSELAAGGFTHVVTTYDPFQPGELSDTKEALWTREDPAAREVLRDGPVSVFELDGAPDPAACGDLPDLTPAELNGDSVNIEPEANQPPARFETQQR
jgi:hypothetical protein